MSRPVRSALAVFVLGLCACAPSEEDVKQDFMKLIAASNACQSVDDCVEVAVDCPLGCGAVVNRNKVSRVERGAKDLIEDYERYGRSCAYDCTGPRELACVEQRCGFASADAGVADAAH